MLIWLQYDTLQPCKVFIDGQELLLAPSLQYYQFSSYGFRWGFPCDGSWQLAFALLLHFCGAVDAQRYFIQFASEVINEIPIDFKLGSYLWADDIKNFVARKKAMRSKWGRWYWKHFGKFHFSDDFYTQYIKPAESYELPEPRPQPLITFKTPPDFDGYFDSLSSAPRSLLSN